MLQVLESEKNSIRTTFSFVGSLWEDVEVSKIQAFINRWGDFFLGRGWLFQRKKSFFKASPACTQNHFSKQTNSHNGRVLLKCCRNPKMLQYSVLRLGGRRVPITKWERRKLALSVRKPNLSLKRIKIRITTEKSVTNLKKTTVTQKLSLLLQATTVTKLLM